MNSPLTIRLEHIQWFDAEPIRFTTGENAYPGCDGAASYVIEGEDHTVSYMLQPFARGPGFTLARPDGSKRHIWGWDGNRDAPTLTPSFLCEAQHPPLTPGSMPIRVHLFLRAGRIELCGDSTVRLAPEPEITPVPPAKPAASGSTSLPGMNRPITMLYIDLDGTVISASAPIGGMPPETCPPISGSVASLQRLASEGFSITYWTGRQEKYRIPTLRWLVKNGFPGVRLLMVPDGTTDYATVKVALLPALGQGENGIVVDDSPRYREGAARKGYRVVDSSCLDWTRIEAEIRKFTSNPT